MALVEGNTTATGYGQPKPVPPPTYGGLVDDNTAYNSVVNNAPPVLAAPTPVVTQKVPPIWDSKYQTWRDPNTGLLAIGNDATGWQWVPESAYPAPVTPPAQIPGAIDQRQVMAPQVSPTALDRAVAKIKLPGSSFAALNPVRQESPSIYQEGPGTPGVPERNAPISLAGLENVPYAYLDPNRNTAPVVEPPGVSYLRDSAGNVMYEQNIMGEYVPVERATMSGLEMLASGASALTASPYQLEEFALDRAVAKIKLPGSSFAALNPVRQESPSIYQDALPPGEPFAATVNAAHKATNFANATTGLTWDTIPIALKHNVAPEVFPDWGNRAPLPRSNVPPLYPEDAYDFGTWHKGVNIDPDVGLSDQNAYFQIMNPYAWEEPSLYRAELAEKSQAMVNQFSSPYTALGQELLASGAITRDPFWPEGVDDGWPNLDFGTGNYYNLGEAGRTRYNQQWIADTPYTPAAAGAIGADTPRFIGSGVVRPGGSSGAGGYYAGPQSTSISFPFYGTFVHERAHLWDDLNAITRNPEAFMRATWVALDDPLAPPWLKAAIEGATARGVGGTGDPIVEAYAHIAEMAAGRMHELPAYMLQFFDTLYTR